MTKCCRICGNERANQDFVVREMMFGLRESFDYFKCGRCGCLQIAEYPHDLARYYPHNYYSLADPGEPDRQGGLKRFLKARRLDHWLGRPTMIGLLASTFFGSPSVGDELLLEMRGAASLGADKPVLDIGCGKGARLMLWSSYGFRDLQGYDPFVAADIRYRNGVTVYKALPEDGAKYAIVIMRHSFEHMARPLEVLRMVAKRLISSDHIVMIAVPLCSSVAFERYGENWVQLDAPRHFYLHTPDSMAILADAAGFRIDRIVYNSTGFQFWASEQYKRDIPLRDPRSRGGNSASPLFSPEEMDAYDAEADRLNDLGLGDQASFYLSLRH